MRKMKRSVVEVMAKANRSAFNELMEKRLLADAPAIARDLGVDAGKLRAALRKHLRAEIDRLNAKPIVIPDPDPTSRSASKPKRK